MAHKTILIIGDYEPGFPAHEAMLDAVRHACQDGEVVLNTRWVASDELATRPQAVAETVGALLAPRATRTVRVLPEPTVAALAEIRKRDIPFLATGDSHDLVLIEIARNLLEMPSAGSTYFTDDVADPVVKELVSARDRAPERRRGILDLEVRPDRILRPFLGPCRREESVDLTHSLNMDYASAMEEAGLHAAGIDAVTGRPFLFTFGANRWHVSAAFLPQLGSADGQPHPLFSGFVAHASGLAGPESAGP